MHIKVTTADLLVRLQAVSVIEAIIKGVFSLIIFRAEASLSMPWSADSGTSGLATITTDARSGIIAGLVLKRESQASPTRHPPMILPVPGASLAQTTSAGSNSITSPLSSCGQDIKWSAEDFINAHLAIRKSGLKHRSCWRQLQAESCALRERGLASGSWANKQSHLRSYIYFTSYFGVQDFPVLLGVLLRYISFLGRSPITFKSASNMIGSVKWFCALLDPPLSRPLRQF
ncbi:unnamed protein product [Meganyctiphanes norvegica]|uniref:Uncharacterized protein n=1 Tax=Meganyctiphanes norvegica TaxID=48144 RepID=A0AAV2SMG9_MEGNR